MDIRSALERALLAVRSDDPAARNDALVLLEMATVFRHGVSICFEKLAITTPDNLNDALMRDAAVFDMNAHLNAMRREADWQSIDVIDAYIAERSMERRRSAEESPVAELFRLINAGHLDKADELHARLAQDGTADPVSLDDAKTAIDRRRRETIRRWP